MDFEEFGKVKFENRKYRYDPKLDIQNRIDFLKDNRDYLHRNEKKLSPKELKKQQILAEIQFTKKQQFFSLLIVISLIALVYAL